MPYMFSAEILMMYSLPSVSLGIYIKKKTCDHSGFQLNFGVLKIWNIWTNLAHGLGCGRRHSGPHVSVGVSLLNDVVGDVDTTAVQRRFP